MSRKGYPREFRDAAVQRVRDGEAVARVSDDIGISYTTLRGWCDKAGVPTRQYRCFIPDSKLVDIGKLVILKECSIVMTSPGWWECDSCGSSIYWDSYDENDPPSCNFCPNCGAKVVER